MRRLFLFVVLWHAYSGIYAQKQSSSHLKDKLKAATTYQQKADIMLELITIYQRVNPDSAYSMALQLKKIATDHQDKWKQYKALLAIGKFLVKKGKHGEAIHICDSILLELQDADRHTIKGEFLQMKGYAFMRLNHKREALNHFYEALKVFEKASSLKGQVTATVNIGWVHMEMFQYEKAITEFLHAKRLAENNESQIDILVLPIIYNNLASCYGAQEKADSAYVYTAKSIDISLKMENYEVAANGLNILGTALMKEKKYKEALDKLLQAQPLRQKVGDPFFIVSDMAILAQLYGDMGNINQAIKTSKEALALTKQYKITAKLPMMYQTLAQIYEKAGAYKEASEAYKLLSTYKDTLFEKASSDAIAQMKVQYETEKKDNENLLLKKENALKAALLTNKNRTIYFLIVFTLFIATLMFAWMSKVRLRQKENELKAIAELQKEKERIARDLHDNVGGQLSYIIYSLDGINDEKREKRSQIIESINQSVRSVIGNLRETIWAISDANIRLQDFSDKLKLYARNLFKHSIIKVTFTDEIPSQKELNALLGLNLYRVCQEILMNAFKYSKADEVTIQLNLQKERLWIKIADNGIGFVMSQQKKENYGLQNIFKRADEFGISIVLDTDLGKGTAYTLLV